MRFIVSLGIFGFSKGVALPGSMGLKGCLRGVLAEVESSVYTDDGDAG